MGREGLHYGEGNHLVMFMVRGPEHTCLWRDGGRERDERGEGRGREGDYITLECNGLSFTVYKNKHTHLMYMCTATPIKHTTYTHTHTHSPSGESLQVSLMGMNTAPHPSLAYLHPSVWSTRVLWVP